MNEAQIQINDLEHKEAKNSQSEQLEEKEPLQKQGLCKKNLRQLQCSNIHIVEVSEGQEKEKEIRSLFEKIMKENFPNLVKEIDMQVQEALRVPNKEDKKRPTPTHITIKMPKG